MPFLHLLVIKTLQPAVLAAFYTNLGFEFDYHQHGNGPRERPGGRKIALVQA